MVMRAPLIAFVPMALRLKEEAMKAGLEINLEELDLTVLGGEPSEQLAGVTGLCAAARGLGLGVIVFTGRTRAELAGLAGGAALLATIDTVIDGRFEAGQREPADGRRFVGSRNQSIVHLTPRYADPALWRGPAGVELQLAADGEIGLHGAPALARRLGRALAGPG